MLSIVIVSYNTCDLLDACLASIRQWCPSAQVIVVDNDSRDNSVAMTREKYANVLLIESKDNLGFAGANNTGIRKATGDFVLLLNSDTVLEDDSLNRCVDWMLQNPKVGAISPSLVGMDGKPQRCFHSFPSLKDRWDEALCRPTEKQDAVVEQGWLAGTALMMRREALQDIGGELDQRYWMYWEDADTSAKLLKAGWQVQEYCDASIRHYGGASGGGPDAGRRADLYAHYAWGEHRWFFKHRPLWESASIWFLDFVDLFRRTIRGVIRSGRRSELTHARVLASVLCFRLFGLRPPVPGGKK